MRIDIDILNPDRVKFSNEDCSPTWHSRRKSYESDQMDEDMICATVSHKVDRIILNDVQLTSKSSVNELILFLNNACTSFES